MAEKLKMESKDIVQENIEFISQRFPNTLKETRDENGNLVKRIDFDVLKQELSSVVIDDKKERYQMTWPGKKNSILLANSRTNKTLRPVKEKSVDFDYTENLYIEGDNLEVLKLLRETYLGKIKVIYIDPPYNTGNDFIYRDNFSESTEDYLKASGQIDEEGNKMVINSDSNGRFHTDWLNMMYSRLKIAKDLLADDGVIFISINDNEVDNLRKMCDEIFCENNFIAMPMRRKNKLVMKGDGTFKNVLEPLIVYAKDKKNVTFLHTKDENSDSDFSMISAGYGIKEIYFKSGSFNFTIKEGVVRAGNYGNLVLNNDIEINNFKNKNNFSIKGEFKWSQEKIDEKLNSNAYILVKNIDTMSPRIHFVTNTSKPIDYIDEQYGKVTNEDGKSNLKKYFIDEVFDYPKPIDFIKFILNIYNDKKALVMDFFAGSGSTAEAIFEINKKDGGNRKFILVQLPENLDEKLKMTPKNQTIKNAIKICDDLHFEHFLTEISEERIRRAGKRIKEENPLIANSLDTGFRVLKLDSSNMNEVYYNPKDVEPSLLEHTIDNVKADRSSLDLLFQVMLELGIELSAKINEKEINGKKYYLVNDNDIIACFDDELDNDLLTEIAKLQPVYAVFKNTSFVNDNAMINCEQIFKTYHKNYQANEKVLKII